MLRKIVLALLLLGLSTPALADAPGPNCYQKVVTVCPAKRPKKKKHVLPPITLVAERPCPACNPRVVVVERKVTVVERVPVVFELRVPVKPCCREWKKLVLGAYGELGIGVRDPYVSGELGIQLEVPQVFLGARAFSEVQYGLGLQGLIYVYRGDFLKVHVIDPGVLFTGGPFRYESDVDIGRNVDLILGAGVQLHIACHLELLLDWRVDLPDPGVLARNDGLRDCSGCGAPGGQTKALDARAAVGNAFAASQLKAGLLVRF